MGVGIFDVFRRLATQPATAHQTSPPPPLPDRDGVCRVVTESRFEPTRAAAIPRHALPVVNLGAEFKRLRAEAEKIAGGPHDVSQRVPFLLEIYFDSRGNHQFPLLAAHGAMWGLKRLQEDRDDIEAYLAVRHPFSAEARAADRAKINAFSTQIMDANRGVFIDTYVNYYFTKQLGRIPGAELFVPKELLDKLNAMHDTNRLGECMTTGDKRALYRQALLTEQEKTVCPRVAAATAAFDLTLPKMVGLKPNVHFAYFPSGETMSFDDFSQQSDRVKYAMQSYDLAAAVGFRHVEATTGEYGIVDRRVLKDLAGFLREARARLVPGPRPRAASTP